MAKPSSTMGMNSETGALSAFRRQKVRITSRTSSSLSGSVAVMILRAFRFFGIHRLRGVNSAARNGAEEIASGSSTKDHRAAIRERRSELRDLFAITRYRPNPEGLERVDHPNAGGTP